MRVRDDAAYVLGLALGVVGLLIFGLAQLRADMLGTDDFATIWAGPRAFLLGMDPYDPATWRDVAVQIGTAHVPDNAVYAYPPWVTIALAPFGLLSTRAAGIVWSAFGVISASIAIRALLGTYLPNMAWAHGIAGLLLLLSEPGAVTFVTGQWTFLFVAALTAILLLLRDGRPIAAGAVAVVMLAKPPLFLFTAPALALRALWTGSPVRGGRRFVAAAIAVAVAVVTASWLILPTWWPAWFENVAAVQVTITPVTVRTLFVAVLGDAGGWLAPIVVLGGTAAALRFDPRGDGWLPVWLALSSMAVIYSNTYDALMLLVPMILATGALRTRSVGRARLVAGAMAALLFVVGWWLHTTDAPRLYAAVIPLGSFVIITSALWPWRRDVRGTAASAPDTAGSSPP